MRITRSPWVLPPPLSPRPRPHTAFPTSPVFVGGGYLNGWGLFEEGKVVDFVMVQSFVFFGRIIIIIIIRSSINLGFFFFFFWGGRGWGLEESKGFVVSLLWVLFYLFIFTGVISVSPVNLHTNDNSISKVHMEHASSHSVQSVYNSLIRKLV